MLRVRGLSRLLRRVKRTPVSHHRVLPRPNPAFLPPSGRSFSCGSFRISTHLYASGTHLVNPPGFPDVATGDTIQQIQKNMRDRPSTQRKHGYDTSRTDRAARVVDVFIARATAVPRGPRGSSGLRQQMRRAEQTRSAEAKIKKIIENASNARRRAQGGWQWARNRERRGKRNNLGRHSRPGSMSMGPNRQRERKAIWGFFFARDGRFSFISFLLFYFLAGSGHVRRRPRHKV